MQVKHLLMIITVLFSLLLPNFAQAQQERPIVRLIYFVPRDRQSQPDINAKMDRLIKNVQKFYANEMEHHGYGRKTFAFETDPTGKAVIHRIKGRFNDKHYSIKNELDISKVSEEIAERFDTSTDPFLVAVDTSNTQWCGVATDGMGFLRAPGDCVRPWVAAHELGHAFRLNHDYRNEYHIMYVSQPNDELLNGITLSETAAGWLDVHPAFNRSRPVVNTNTAIEMLPPSLASPPHTIRVRFKVTDPDGLHQAQLLGTYRFPLYTDRRGLLDYKYLNGERNKIVEFVTTGIAPRDERVALGITDVHGNATYIEFPIDITALLPRSQVVFIPDANLASAVREALKLAPRAAITTHAILGLTSLSAPATGIADLTGLQHALNLTELAVGENPISDVSPLAGLTRLNQLWLQDTLISDISALSGLTQLNWLFLNHNSISDISALSDLTQLKNLYLEDNLISDISPLSGLTQLTSVTLYGNNISDISALSDLIQLTGLGLGDNPVSDISALSALTQLKNLSLGNTPISDISALSGLTQLTSLSFRNTSISDISPLSGLTQLKVLWLRGNPISDISALSGLTQLTELYLEDNSISDISALSDLMQLKVLRLRNNSISDVSSLVGLNLTGTEWDKIGLTLQGNSLSYASIHTHIPAMQAKGIKVNFDTDIASKEVDIDISRTPVPTTGTWFAVEKPSGLAPEDFTIGPGKFVILAHRDKQVTTRQAEVKTYASYFAFNAKVNDFPNLANFFKNGGRIELVSHVTLNPLPPNTRKPKFGDLVISEIMWGLNTRWQDKQYIEVYNASAHTYTFTDGNLGFRFSTAAETPLPNEVFSLPANPNAKVKVIDRVSNKGWKVPGKSGNISQNQPLISMYRAIDYTAGDTPDGTLASSWQASAGRVNLPAPSYGTPGAKHLPPAPIVHVDAAQRPPLYWIDTDNGTLHRLVGTDVETLVPNVQNATGLAIDVAGGKLYWTEKTSDRTGRIRRANLDGTNVQLVKALTSVPHGIALDAGNGKIYVTNAWGKVQGLNVDGSNFQPNLITNLDAPRGIALDVAAGKVYWAEGSGHIRRANLDGSNVQNVATGLTELTSLAVANGKIYWTSGGKLQRANLNGTNSEVLETLPSAPTGIAVDTVRNALYLTSPSGEIQRRNLDSSGYQPVVTGLVSPRNIVLGTPAITPVPPDTTAPPETPVVDAAADVNQDQKVNKTDLLLVATALGESPPANPKFDVNADGAVNIADVLLVIEALDDPVAAAAPALGETVTSLDPGLLRTQIELLRVESDGSLKYEQAIAFFQGLLAAIRPAETRLLANYPNPFNPETWIPYQLAESGEVTVRIYDVKGGLVRTLALGHQTAGIYQSRSRAAYWDGRNTFGESVASGLYFYTLTAGDFTTTRKMLIRK